MTFFEHLDAEFSHSKQAFLHVLNTLPTAKTIVINIGVNSLVYDTGLLNLRTFKNFIKDVSELTNSRSDRHVIIVVSDYLDGVKHKYLQQKEDMPAINSNYYSALLTLAHNDLANLFCEGFSDYSLRAIGISLSAFGYENSGELNKIFKTLESIAFSQNKSTDVKITAIKDLLNSKRNIIKASYQKNRVKKTTDTLKGLFRHFPRTIPIIMEDVSQENTMEGDEEFAARIAAAMDADAFLTISKKGMLFTVDPEKSATRALPFYCYDTGRKSPFTDSRQEKLSKKLNASAYLSEHKKLIPMLLSPVDRPFAITDIFSEKGREKICTKGAFPTFTTFINSKSNSLPVECRSASGSIKLDENAVKALIRKKGSLLLAGITEVDGDFETKSVVIIMDMDSNEIGRGVVNHNSSEIKRYMADLEEGNTLNLPESEVISRNKMRLNQSTGAGA